VGVGGFSGSFDDFFYIITEFAGLTCFILNAKNAKVQSRRGRYLCVKGINYLWRLKDLLFSLRRLLHVSVTWAMIFFADLASIPASVAT